jgi:hypothetical protein
MSWAGLPIGFHDQPGTLDCSLAAIGVHTLALSWSAKYKARGRIPIAVATFLARGQATLCDELVACGLWAPSADGFTIGGYYDSHPKYGNRHIPAGVRLAVLERDGFVCGLCGQEVAGPFHLDHVKPFSRGGRHTVRNLQVTHHECNLLKGARP